MRRDVGVGNSMVVEDTIDIAVVEDAEACRQFDVVDTVPRMMKDSGVDEDVDDS